jgi:hypothetical protein
MKVIKINILEKERDVLFFNDAKEGLFKVKCDIFLVTDKCRVLRASTGIFGKQINFCSQALIFSVFLGYDLSTCENVKTCFGDREKIVQKWNVFFNHFNGNWKNMYDYMLENKSFDFDNIHSNPNKQENTNKSNEISTKKLDFTYIDNLIDMACASGEITDEIRDIIIRKASAQLEIDLDEAEIIVKGKISLKNKPKDSAPNTTLPSNKEGVIIKCPACGEPTKSMTSECHACGHEFRSVVNRSTILILNQQLSEIEVYEWENNQFNGKNGQPKLDHMVRDSIAAKQCPIIDNFPIPNSKEEIFEFLSMALPIGLKSFSWSEQFTNAAEKQLSKSYKAKAQQSIIKGRMILKNDKEAMEQLNYYSQQLGI